MLMKSDMDNLLYYSTNSYLAFQLAENYYRGKHFVWCSPVFAPEELSELDIRKNIPPSSSPNKIYIKLIEDIHRADMHSSLIEQNKSGLKKGALIHHKAGIIDDNDLVRINKLIDSAKLKDFRPLLYLIPKNLVESKIIEVDIDDKANPLDVEYQIVDLNKNEFEIIQPIKQVLW
jgi:hypothetical protein